MNDIWNEIRRGCAEFNHPSAFSGFYLHPRTYVVYLIDATIEWTSGKPNAARIIYEIASLNPLN